MKLNSGKNILKILYNITLILLIVIIVICVVSVGYIFIEKKYVYPLKYEKEIIEASEKYGINSALVFAVVKVESGFNKNAQSEKGAMGLMQITESTGKYIAEKKNIENYNLFDEKTNLDFGCYYISYLMEMFVDIETTMIAYNAGENRVKLWLANKEYSMDGKRLDKVPYKETKEYVEKINKTFYKYKKLYRKLLDKD